MNNGRNKQNNAGLKVRYSTGKVISKEGCNYPEYRFKTYKKDNVKRYMNCQYKLAKLPKVAEMLLRFLCEEMNTANVVYITKQTRESFRHHMSKDCALEYKDDTVKKAIHALVQNELLIKVGSRIDYVVNPIYYFSGSEKDRNKVINQLIKHWEGDRDNNDNIKKALKLV